MISYATAQHIAHLRIDGLPTDKSAVIRRASREGWPSRKREGRGGGREYCIQWLIKHLPREASDALVTALVAEPAASLPVAAEPRAVAIATPAVPTADWQRETAEARAALLLEIERIGAITGTDRAIDEVVALAAAGELRPDLQALVPAANARGGKTSTRTLSRRTMYRWRTIYAERGIEGLTPVASPASDIPPWGAALLKLYRSPTKKTLAAVMADLPAALPEGVPVPSYDAARRFLQRVSVVDRNRGRHGPNGLLKFKAFKRRSTESLLPLDVVSSDGHSFKADIAHPRHGQPFRPEVCAIQDLATRYVFGWSAGLAESSTVVMDTIRSGVEQLGLFGIFYTDNGSGFIASALTAEATGFLARLGATPLNSLPGRAQARGKIERLQGSLWKTAARELATYNARDMDAEARRKVVKIIDKDLKQRGGSRFLMSWEDFLAFAQAKVDAYNNRPHRSLPKIRDEATGTMRHMTPAERLDEFRTQGWEPATLTAAEAADLWRPYELRTTTRGEVKLPWGRYFSKELEPFGGEKVRVGYDIHDGTRVWVRTAEGGKLICIAERDANVIPEQPQSKVEHAREKRQLGRLNLINQHRDEILAESGPRLIGHAPEPVFNAAIDARQKEIEADLLSPRPQVVEINPRTTRFHRALAVEQRINAAEPVSEDEVRWYRVYSAQPEYRAARAMYEDFGEDALLEA